MIKHLSLYLGIAAIFGGLTLFAVSVASDDAYTAHGQEATVTAADDGTTTPDADTTGTPDDGDDDATRTPGPLTPVSTPTTGGAGGTTSTPVAGGASGLPDTGMGTTQDAGFNWIALAGMLVVVAGGGIALAGARRS